jgi:hypothetical protein
VCLLADGIPFRFFFFFCCCFSFLSLFLVGLGPGLLLPLLLLSGLLLSALLQRHLHDLVANDHLLFGEHGVVILLAQPADFALVARHFAHLCAALVCRKAIYQ